MEWLSGLHSLTDLHSLTGMLVVVALGCSRPHVSPVGSGLRPAPAKGPPTTAPRHATPPKWLADRCRTPDEPLGRVASMAARGELSARDADAVTRAMRTHGSAYREPRVWILTGSSLEPSESAARLDHWTKNPEPPAQRRCGIGFVKSASAETAVFLAVDALADPTSIPFRARSGTWLRIGAELLAPAPYAKFVALAPTRPPFTLPTSITANRIAAALALDEPGLWLVQLLVDTGAGPIPVLDSPIFVDQEPSEQPWMTTAPGEESADGAANSTPQAMADSMARMIDRARHAASRRPLFRDPTLDHVAQGHAETMRKAGRLAHDLGKGNPAERVARTGVEVSEVGENTARAATPVLAHRALWHSPSHRMNLLGERYTHMGIGCAQDPDGTVWIAELFATR